MEFFKQSFPNYESEGYTLEQLFEADAGVGEGYTIEEHTEMVHDRIESQIQFLDQETIPIEDPINTLQFMRTLISLHDIGKPIALRKGNRDLQHEETTKIVTELLKELGFKDSQITLATTLLESDILGSLLKNQITEQEAFNLISEAAEKTGLDVETYFNLFNLLYISDSSSYQFLENLLFDTNEQEQLEIKTTNMNYYRLKKMIEFASGNMQEGNAYQNDKEFVRIIRVIRDKDELEYETIIETERGVIKRTVQHSRIMELMKEGNAKFIPFPYKNVVTDAERLLQEHTESINQRTHVSYLDPQSGLLAHGTNLFTIFQSLQTNLQLRPTSTLDEKTIIGTGESGGSTNLNQNYVSTMDTTHSGGITKANEYAQHSSSDEFTPGILSNFVATRENIDQKIEHQKGTIEWQKENYPDLEEGITEAENKLQHLIELKQKLLEMSDEDYETYLTLSTIPVTVIGEGFGHWYRPVGISGEIAIERLNTRIIATTPEHIETVKQLLENNGIHDVVVIDYETLEQHSQSRSLMQLIQDNIPEEQLLNRGTPTERYDPHTISEIANSVEERLRNEEIINELTVLGFDTEYEFTVIINGEPSTDWKITVIGEGQITLEKEDEVVYRTLDQLIEEQTATT